MRVGDIKGIAPWHIAEPLLAHSSDTLGQSKVDSGSFLHTGIQHEHSPGVVLTHQYVYVDGITPIEHSMFTGKVEEALRDTVSHGAYRSVLGVVAWIVLTRAGLAAYVQALQRRAHTFGTKDCKLFDLVIRHVELHTCGLKSIALKHPFELLGSIGAAFKAQPDEPTGLALRGVVATLQGDQGSNDQPMSLSGKANLIDFTVRRRRRAGR